MWACPQLVVHWAIQPGTRLILKIVDVGQLLSSKPSTEPSSPITTPPTLRFTRSAAIKCHSLRYLLNHGLLMQVMIEYSIIFKVLKCK